MESKDEYYTILEICRLLKVCRKTVERMIDKGMIKAIDLNPCGKHRQYRIERAELERLRDRKNKQKAL